MFPANFEPRKPETAKKGLVTIKYSKNFDRANSSNGINSCSSTEKGLGMTNYFANLDS